VLRVLHAPRCESWGADPDGIAYMQLCAVREEPGAVDGSLWRKALMTNVTFL